MNSVKEICGILRKYIVKEQLINPDDVTVICADNKENRSELHKVHSKLNIASSIPKDGDPHTTWTFVTRTAFEGVDFYSPSASTYVIANYNVSSLSLDIASDIPQIIGRQRKKDNLFRNTIHIFFKDNKRVVGDAEFIKSQEQKMKKSEEYIEIWQSAPSHCKETTLKMINNCIEYNSNESYVSTTNGEPVINNLLIISERYCFDVIKNHHQWFIMASNASGRIYSMPVQELKEKLNIAKNLSDALKVSYDHFVCADKVQRADYFIMLHNEGYNQIGYYYSNLSTDRIRACGFNCTKLDEAIYNNNAEFDIRMRLPQYFELNGVYTREEVKGKLQRIYNELGLKLTAKATDLEKYVNCIQCKKNASRAYKLLPG